VGLAPRAGASYFFNMGVHPAKRLALVLTAIAFMLATILPGSAAVTSMAAGAGMASETGHPCGDCPDKASTSNDTAKMECGALACLGVLLALPIRQILRVPAFMATDYGPTVLVERSGASPAPDPFPPRSTVLI
jgi:hypothetical protein